MLNEEKIRYMTELAIFEKNEGRKIFPVNRFFRSDYVGGQMFRGFFGYTFSFLLIVLTSRIQAEKNGEEELYDRTAALERASEGILSEI